MSGNPSLALSVDKPRLRDGAWVTPARLSVAAREPPRKNIKPCGLRESTRCKARRILAARWPVCCTNRSPKRNRQERNPQAQKGRSRQKRKRNESSFRISVTNLAQIQEITRMAVERTLAIIK